MRNMIAANRKAFGRLVSLYDDKTGNSTKEEQRYIKTDPEEKDWLKEAKIVSHCIIMPNYQACAVAFREKVYFVLIGPKITIENLDYSLLSECPNNAGLFTLLISELEIIKKKSFDTLKFEENILSQHLSENYNGIDFNDLSPFISDIDLYEIPKESIFYSIDLYRIASYLFAASKDALTLEFAHETIEIYIKAILEGSDKISFENIFNSLTSINWKHCYLEIYRNVERLFPITYLKDLYQTLNLNITFFEFCAKVEKSMGWRPKEDEALDKLFIYNSDNLKTRITELLDKIPGVEKSQPHSFVYKLRNAIVHYRSSDSQISFTTPIWNEIISLKLLILMHIYDELKSFI